MARNMEDTDLNRARIFFSYSRRDGEFALRLAKDLRKRGVQVWLDQLDIPSGARWDDEIEVALRITKTMLVILSPDSVGSEHVRDEVNVALRDGDHIIPVLYRSCEVPLRLSRVQYVDFTGDYASGLARLHAHCSARRDGESSAAPSPTPHAPSSLHPVTRSSPPGARRFGVMHGVAAGGVLSLVGLVSLGVILDNSGKQLHALLSADLDAIKSSGLALGKVDCPEDLSVEAGQSFDCSSSADGVPLTLRFTARARLEDGPVDHFDLTLDGAVAADAVQGEAQRRFGSDYLVVCPRQRWVAKPEATQECTLSLGRQSETLRVRTTDSHGAFDLELDRAMTKSDVLRELGNDYAEMESLSCGGLRVLLKQRTAKQPYVCKLRFTNGEEVSMNVYFKNPGADVDYDPSSEVDDKIAHTHELRTAQRRAPAVPPTTSATSP
jgi:hypothetical protein